MSRGTTLLDIRDMIRAELGYSMEVGVSEQANARLNVLAANKQKLLASHFDWPFLERQWNTVVAAGANTLDVPENPGDELINFERPVKLEVLYNGFYLPVEYGVDANEYNIIIEQDPAQRWRFQGDGAAGDVIEVWPRALSEQNLRFTGQRCLRPLKADEDVADLDDLLIAFFVAADLAAEAESKSAPVKAAQAQERLRMLLQVYPHREEDLVLGQNLRRVSKNRKIIAIAP